MAMALETGVAMGGVLCTGTAGDYFLSFVGCLLSLFCVALELSREGVSQALVVAVPTRCKTSPRMTVCLWTCAKKKGAVTFGNP